MKNITKLIIGCVTSALLVSACAKKDEKLEITSYAKLTVGVASLPGTPELEVRYMDENIGDAPIGLPGTLVEASSNSKIAVYVKGTNELVADSTISLKKGEVGAFKVAYSKDFGLSGWVNSKPVSPDSISVQILNNLGDYYKAYPKYDLDVFYFDYNTGEIIAAGYGIHDFQKVKLTPLAVMLPYYYDKSQLMYHTYLGRLKDPATGQYILMPSGQDFFILEPSTEGSTIIYNISDLNGEITGSAIYL